MNSQVTLNKNDQAHISKVIVAVDEEFIKSHGDPVSLTKMLNNQGFRKFAQDNRFLHNKNQDKMFVKGFIEEVVRNTERLKKKFYMKPGEHQTIYRNNEYKVKNDKQLQALIQKHPEGLQVNDELLKYTYKKVNADIQRLVKENSFRRLYFKKPLDKNNASYIIFPKKEEKSFNIVPYPNQHQKIFDFRKYLETCSKINPSEGGGELSQIQKNRRFKESTSDPNYRLPGYKELKQEWVKKNQKKDKK